MEIPGSFFVDKLCFFRNSLREIIFLKISRLHLDGDTSFQSIERYGLSFDRIRSLIKVNTAMFVKNNCRNFFLTSNVFSLVSFTNRENCIAHHLRSQRRGLSHQGVDVIVKSYTIPTSILYSKRHDLITSICVSVSKICQSLSRFFGSIQFNGNCSFHWRGIIYICYFNCNLKKEEQRFLLTLKGKVSALSIG